MFQPGNTHFPPYLIKPVFSSVADVDELEDLALESAVEHVRLRELGFEVGRTGEDQAVDVGFVVGDEKLRGHLRHFAHVIVPLLHPQSGESKGRLTASTVLLGQVDGKLVEDVASVALQRAEQGAVTVHDDEAELVVVGEQLGERFRVELVVAQVERRVDGFERFEIDIDFLLLAVVGDDGPAVDDETVGRHFVVQLEPLLDRRDGRQDGESVDAGFDVGGGAELVGQHFTHAGDLVFGGNDEGNHGSAVSPGILQSFDQFLDLPNLDVGVGSLVGHPGGGGCGRGRRTVDGVESGRRRGRGRRRAKCVIRSVGDRATIGNGGEEEVHELSILRVFNYGW